MLAWGQIIIAAIIALFPIMDPIGAIPVVLAVTEGDTEQRRREQIRKACIYVFWMLTGFLIAGNLIMSIFGISIPGIRIAGGIILFGLARGMLQAQPKYPQSQEERTESVNKPDVSFTPLAMPLLSGPGAIAVTLGLTSLTRHWYDYLAIIVAIGIVTTTTWLILQASTNVIKVLGVNGMNIVERLMGFLLLCVSVQFILNGILAIVTEQTIL